MSTVLEDIKVDDKLDGATVPKVVEELLGYYRLRVKEEGQLTDPNSDRANRIKSHSSGLEKIVKAELGDSQRASEKQARVIVDKLAYALAQTHGYSGKPEALTEERKAEYVNNTLAQLGIPGVSNAKQLIESIMNLAAANPDSTLYDANGSLAQFINLIAARNDNESLRIQYLNQLILAAAQQPGKGIMLQKAFNEVFGFGLKPTATGTDMLTEVRTYGASQTQEYARRMPKTYAAPNVSEHIAGEANAAASGKHGRS